MMLDRSSHQIGSYTPVKEEAAPRNDHKRTDERTGSNFADHMDSGERWENN